MAEYIVDIDAIWDLFDSGIVDKSEVHERIVRCRDCKFFEHCKLQMISNKPGGFCAWGEPKPTVEDQSKRWADPR